MSDWADKTVVVTGGSAGLGKAIAMAFAERGAQVVIMGRDPERLEKAAAESERITPLAADVADPQQARDAVASILERHGAIDIWINNVGGSTRGRVVDADSESIRAGIEQNLFTAVHCVQAALDSVRLRRGSFVFIGSLASKTASPFIGWYPVAKFALAGYAHQLRLELRDDNVHVMLVCPGPIRRMDEGSRYDSEASELPDSARRPGGGAKIKGLSPEWVAERIVRGCESRKPELVLPWKARVLFAISQLSPRLGDWILGKMTRSDNPSE